MKIDKSKLFTLAEINEILYIKGPAMAGFVEYIRGKYSEVFGEDLVSHYPYCDVDYRGCFLIAAQEGVLIAPYDEVTKKEGELINAMEIKLIDVADVDTFRKYMQEHASGFERDMDILRSIYSD